MEEEITKVSEKLNERTLYNSLHRAYLQIEELYKEYGFTTEASRCLSQSVHYRLKLASSIRERVLLWISQPFTRHDKNKWFLLTGLFIACIILISLLFGVFYWKFELIKFSEENFRPLSFRDSFYFSVVTFTTLGYGDLKPACIQGRMLAISEVICGYVILGLSISILAWKMTQR